MLNLFIVHQLWHVVGSPQCLCAAYVPIVLKQTAVVLCRRQKETRVRKCTDLGHECRIKREILSSQQERMPVISCDCIVLSVGGNLLHCSWLKQTACCGVAGLQQDQAHNETCLVHRRYSHEMRRNLTQHMHCGLCRDGFEESPVSC